MVQLNASTLSSVKEWRARRRAEKRNVWIQFGEGGFLARFLMTG